MGKVFILQICLIIDGFMVVLIIDVMEIKYQKLVTLLLLLQMQYIITKMVIEK
jgi:hypothetical protein